MPEEWSNKRERQYQHIKQSARKRGHSVKEAEEIAARTVNKQRRMDSETPNKTSQGTGNPNSPLDERTRQELYNRAKQLNITGRSTMDKAELIHAIRTRQ